MLGISDLSASRGRGRLRYGYGVFCGALFARASTQLAAQAPPGHGIRHSLTIDDLLANQAIEYAAISADGERAAVVIQRSMTTGHERYGYNLNALERTDIWLIGRRAPPVNLTRGDRDGAWSWQPLWSPDGRYLAFLSRRGEDVIRIRTWDRVTHAIRTIAARPPQLDATFANSGASMAWAGPPMTWVSDRALLVAFAPRDERPFLFATGPARLQSLDSAWIATESGNRASVSVMEGGIRIPESARPQGSLALCDIPSGRTSILAEINVRDVALSPDKRVAAIIAEDGNVVPNAGLSMEWPPDVDRAPHLHFWTRRRLAVLSLQPGGQLRWVGAVANPYFAVTNEVWLPAGSRFIVMSDTSADTSAHFAGISIDRAGEAIGNASDSLHVQAPVTATGAPTGPGRLPAGDYGSAARLLAYSPHTGFSVFTSEPSDGTILWTSDSSSPTPRIRLRLNAHLDDVADDVGQLRLIRYTAADGTSRLARAILPSGYTPGTRYPLVVRVYPGAVVEDSLDSSVVRKPHTGALAFLNSALWAVHGYVVLEPSIPASTGEPIRDFAGFVLPAIDTLVAHGVVDSGRVGLLGHSHGAIAVYGLLTTTSRFRSAVAITGWSDIVHYYASVAANNELSPYANEWVTSGFYTFEQTRRALPATHGLWIGTTPWEDPGRWLRNNPLYHFDRIVTPLLIVRGDNDFFSIADGDVAFQSLHRLGKRVRYVRYWGEQHLIDSPANIRDMWSRVLAWFEDTMPGGGPRRIKAASRGSLRGERIPGATPTQGP